jgi:hypothetical protein
LDFGTEVNALHAEMSNKAIVEKRHFMLLVKDMWCVVDLIVKQSHSAFAIVAAVP